MFKKTIEYICENNDTVKDIHEFAEEVNIDYDKGKELQNKNDFSVGKFVIFILGAKIIDELFLKKLHNKYNKHLLKKIYYKHEIKKLEKLYNKVPDSKKDVKLEIKNRLDSSKQNLRNL
jgi:hypothetical protein